MELLDKGQLAERLGRSRGYVSAMCKAGFKAPCGRTTLRAALEWMAANPDFRMSDVYARATTLKVTRKKSSRGTRLSGRA
jgi:hypothetical protein